MLPGKTFTPEDVLVILRRRYWLLLVPFAIVSALSAAAVRKMPDWYRSETVILVIPQRVPESYVRSTVTTRIEDRLQSISQQIMSRTRLERIIQEFNLYAEERRTGIMEDIVEKMRLDIRTDIVKGDAFKVSYIGREPRTVMRVTERLATLFMDENVRDRENLAENTNQFLESQLEDARRRLIDQEQRLEQYRRQHAGELPSQLNSNLQAIQNTQMQVQAIMEALNRDRERRLVLERQLADAEATSIETSPAPAVSSVDPTMATGTAAQQLEVARAQLKALEMKFTPNHPDIAFYKRRIRDLEEKADAEALAVPVSAEAAPRPASPAAFARQQRIKGLREDIEQVDRQIAQKLSDEKRLREISSSYQSKVEAAPTRETELIELTRDYAGVQQMYANLLSKREDSKIAANLERRSAGETFKLIDPARMPERPFSPNRQRYNLMGIAAGLGIGMFLVAVLEYRDRSFRTDSEVARLLELPVLAVVPLMQSDGERRRQFARRLVLGVGLGSTVAVCFAVVAYTFLR